MASFKLPLSICKRIQSALTRFWWDSNPETKGICWVARDKLTKSKRDGGLGFRDVEAFNDAMLAKVSWRILMKPDSLLARILTSKYCRKEGFLSVKGTTTMSHEWRGILIGRDLLAQNVGFAIGNGRKTKIWEDSWISLQKHEVVHGPTTEETRNWTMANLFKEGTTNWDTEKIKRILPDRVEEILSLHPSQTGTEDKRIWLHDKYGTYTTKTGYHIARGLKETKEQHESISSSGNAEWERDAWKRKVSPKIQVFLWKAMKGALAVRESLTRRHITQTEGCIRCGKPESVEHVIFMCDYAQRVWEARPFEKRIEMTADMTMAEFLRANRHIKTLPPVGVKEETLLAFLCWNIWVSRNKAIFEGRHLGESDLVTKASAETREWSRAQEKAKEEGPQTMTKQSKPMPQRGHTDNNTTEVWTDAAWRQNTKEAGLGWVISDPNGSCIRREMMHKRMVPSPLMAEAQACTEALKQVRALQRSKMRIFSDSLNLIRALAENNYQNEIYGVAADIINLTKEFEMVEFVFLPRKENGEADLIAKRAFDCVYDDLIFRV